MIMLCFKVIKYINCIKLYFIVSFVGKSSVMDSESYQRMFFIDVYDEILEVKEEYDLAFDFQ